MKKSSVFEVDRRGWFAASAVPAMMALSILASPMVASANALPPYQINLQVGSGGVFSTTPGVALIGCSGGPFCSAYAGLSLPNVIVQGDGASINVSSSATLKYQFQITGPSTGVAIPIHIDGVALFSANDGIASGGLFFGEFNSSTSYLYQFNCSNGVNIVNCTEQPGDFHLTQDVFSGIVYTIGLSAGGAVPGSARGTYYSEVDPAITIDPSFPDAGLYTITLSDGIGAAVDAPEPSSLIFMSAGILGLGVVRRLRRR